MNRYRFWATKFDLDIAFDARGLFPIELLAPGTNPRMTGPWRVYRGIGNPSPPKP
jgi:hypothetical protein